MVERKHRVTLSQAHKGTLEVDTLLLDSFGAPPENVREFYLRSREAFVANADADFSDEVFVKLAKQKGIKLMGGPMLGDLRSDQVSVWLRPSNNDPLALSVGKTEEKESRLVKVPESKAGVETRVLLDNLSPNTSYKYSVMSGEDVLASGKFRTAPDDDFKGVFRVAFGADFHKVGLPNPNLYNAIKAREPWAMLFYGDTAVDGRKNNINMHRSDYLLRDVSPPWKSFVANTPVYATWDDWDYFTNDTNGVSKRFGEKDREAVRNVWHTNWNNPVNDPERSAIYFKTRMGPVEVFMLDTRSCRENERRGKYGCYLGKEQQEWLKKGLKESTAPFKILSSGTMWSDYVSKAKDTWGSWDTEAREEIFSVNEKEKIGGVLLISGDRHGARGFKIPRKSGYNFYEFEVGTLGGVPGPAGLVKDCPEQLFGYDGNSTIAFGEYTFDTSADVPTVTFRLIRETGEILEEHKLTLKELTP